MKEININPFDMDVMNSKSVLYVPTYNRIPVLNE